MPEKDELLNVARQWAEKAENDLKTAVHTLDMEDCPTDTVCFHAQQAVEKYLKAVLVVSNIDFPKTHNLAELVARLPENTDADISPENQERLTDYATVTRYPGDYEPISLPEARQAVEIAKRVRDNLRSHLPKVVLE